MVNKITIPQTEEITYLNNLTPSYEEFMKTYQSDDKVSASYESEINSYNDLGVEMGYGPCSDSKCYGSNACLSGEYFYPLRVPCPTERCRGKGGSPISWVHARSGC